MRKISNRSVILFGTILVLSGGLWGCSNKTATTGESSTTAISENQLFPEIDRTTLITPSGYADTEAAVAGNLASSGKGATATNLQIGNTTRIKAARYKLEGIVRIKSANSVSLENFIYDGTCPGFKLYLTRSNVPTLEVVPFNLGNRAYNNETMTINFPSGVSIDNVDAAAMTCTGKEDPIFVTELE